MVLNYMLGDEKQKRGLSLGQRVNSILNAKVEMALFEWSAGVVV